MASLTELQRQIDALGHDRRKLLVWACLESELRHLTEQRRAPWMQGSRKETDRLRLWQHELSLRRLIKQSHATLTFVGRVLGYLP